MHVLQIVTVLFWLLIGLFYLGFLFPYQQLIIGGCALVIGGVRLAGLLQK